MVKLNYGNMMCDAIGEQGITEDDFKKNRSLIEDSFAEVMNNKGSGWQEWCSLPFLDEERIKEIEDYGKMICERAESVVVLGIGGSALGAIAASNALLHLRHNELPRSIRKAPKFYVEDNIDPERMNALIDVVDIAKSEFIVITKSGETSETLSQFLSIYDILKSKTAGNAKDHITVITSINQGSLYKIAIDEGFKIFGIEKGVGGRFSVFSAVGLVPLACVGIDIRGFLDGARCGTNNCSQANIFHNKGLLAAFLEYISMKRGKNISIMMPYADSLKYIADFYAQLWGESLGKAADKNGKIVNVGQTPVKALGVTDQHSQVQLFTEGPFDKVVTFLGVENFRSDRVIPSDKSIDGIEFLKGHTFSELINAERDATIYALRKAKRSNFTFLLDKISEQSLGELLIIMMYQTAFAGAMLNIDTFNQPGVEEGKKATFAMLGRRGFEEKLAEINGCKENNYIVE